LRFLSWNGSSNFLSNDEADFKVNPDGSFFNLKSFNCADEYETKQQTSKK
jgi:hypothetical protein